MVPTLWYCDRFAEFQSEKQKGSEKCRGENDLLITL